MNDSFDPDIIKVGDLLEITHEFETRTALIRLIEVLDEWESIRKKELRRAETKKTVEV